MKKMMFTMLIGLISLGAHADSGAGGELTDYWNSRYIIQDKISEQEGIPNTGVSTGYQTHYVKIINVCQEDNEVRTIKPISTCAEWGYKPLSRAQCNNRDQTFPCYDRDERVCSKTVLATGKAPIKYKQQTCAKLTDIESREWRRTHDDDRFKDDYPNCSVFKTFNATKRTSFTFNIIKKVGENHPNYERRFNGDFLFELDFDIPQCEAALQLTLLYLSPSLKGPSIHLGLSLLEVNNKASVKVHEDRAHEISAVYVFTFG